ncbi:helix-turn-helix transcriptional regulator [Alistipes sp. ZOR0009]|jgi:DNA-binding CsgD family transcriptional regulator|uniref:helix-turn-helix transcriptional regulator n=1 Tax=Alistipes sp. ZOR0009 TaxID=1339253 RepID=UPI000646AE34|nr:LuxR C-terminal-related transcriptional regulator [Alistipes sp. ZOR0009]
MVGRLSFFYENMEFGEGLDEVTYENHVITFATYAKISESTLYYVDEYCRKIFMASYNPKISDTKFERELDYAFWVDHLNEEGIALLNQINKAVHHFLSADGKNLGWNFNLTFGLFLKLDKHFRQFTIVGIPVDFVGDKLRSMLFIVRPEKEHDLPFLVISYGKNEKNFKYDFKNEKFQELKKVELTPTELQIINYSGQGFSEVEICEKMNISMPDLKNIKYKLFMRLNVKNMPQALFTIHKLGLLGK